MWIGATDKDEEGTFTWEYKALPFDAQDLWDVGEPRQVLDEYDCVMLTRQGRLKVRSCKDQFFSLCISSNEVGFWFGENERFLCHCDTCTKSECSLNMGRCHRGWFGMKCQYRDLTGPAYLATSSEPRLTDNRNDTCLHNSIDQQLRISFKHEQYFTWLRVVVKQSVDQEMPNEYSLQFQSTRPELGTIRHLCTSPPHIFQMDPVTTDIYCTPKIRYVNKLTLTWKGRQTLCSIHISGGRNVALKIATTLTNFGDMDNSTFTVDGNTTTCLQTNQALERQKLSLMFESPQHIHEIVIRSPAEFQFDILEGFKLEYFGESGQILHSFRHMDNSTRGVIILKSVHNFPILRIEISLVNKQHSLHICEIEAYGDCSSPVYGLYCNEICSISCADQICLYNGMCYACERGRSGQFCLKGNNSQETWEAGKNDSYIPTPPPDHGRKTARLLSGTDLILFLMYFIVLSVLLSLAAMYICTRGSNSEDDQDINDGADISYGPSKSSLHSAPSKNTLKERPSQKNILQSSKSWTYSHSGKASEYFSVKSSSSSSSSSSGIVPIIVNDSTVFKVKKKVRGSLGDPVDAEITAPKPTETAPKPTETATKPTEIATKPTETAPKPTETTDPKLTKTDPKSTETLAPKPTERTDPKPTETTAPKPTETTAPKLTKTDPKSTETTDPKSTETTDPKSTETTDPKLTKTDPKSTETTAPKPTETTDPKPTETTDPKSTETTDPNFYA
ncbi:uncharacterized protein LOC131943484 [Physella acuta]|uniref:uncharacterized protein LOC131943484 n=1 Tax=Physella acuta TaxID=109671 RepID=UPI0027DC09A8|nr:uncharacterized protein LOC131943484 [Physella acuta]